MDVLHWILLLSAAFVAGFVDAVIGGGGLIQLPAFMFSMPGKELPLIFGTNKFAGFSGTLVATFRYLIRTRILFLLIIPAAVFAIPFSMLGAFAVKGINKEILNPIVLFLFVTVAIYTFVKKDFGLKTVKSLSNNKMVFYSCLTGIIIGFYDGFFGPGTGSFLVFIYSFLFGMEFMQASAHAKVVNCITNLAALSLFIWNGDVHYKMALPVAGVNIAGSLIGSQLALKKGSGFIRVFYILVVSGFAIKMAYDIFTV